MACVALINQRIIKLLLITVLQLSLFTEVLAWPNVKLPPQAEMESKLAEQIIVNGIPIQVTNFKSRLSVNHVLNYYRYKWADGFSESKLGQWMQISRLDGEYFFTIQVRELNVIDDGFITVGRINISNMGKNFNQQVKMYPMLSGSRIMNDIQTVDKNKKSRSLLFRNGSTPDDNADFYKQHYKKEHWNKVMEQSPQLSQHALVFSKNKDEVNITIHAIKSGSSILVNEVKAKDWFN